MIVISIIITNMLPSFVCLGLSLVWVRVPIIGSEHCLPLWVTDSCCCCLTEVTEEDSNSMTVNGVTGTGSAPSNQWWLKFGQDFEAEFFVKTLSLKFGRDVEAEIWSRFLGWILVEILKLTNFWGDLKAITLVKELKPWAFGKVGLISPRFL